MAINMETKDLVLRETVLEDVETFEKWERLPEVTEFFSIRDGQTREECFEKFFADKADPGKIQLSIFLKEGNRLIGRIVIGDIEPEWKCELCLECSHVDLECLCICFYEIKLESGSL